jgi:glucosamine-6-phosphate deaminase
MDAMDGPSRTLTVEGMRVEVYPSRPELGRAVAAAVATAMRAGLSRKGRLSMVFAAAASQVEFLEELVRQPGLDWSRVTAFHMDEYVGVAGTARESFGRWLRERLFDRVKIGRAHYLDGMAGDPERECERYAALLRESPLDITCLGIGENGHLAFNDPPVADFSDPRSVKVVTIDEQSRIQQSAEGNFRTPEEVPSVALTMTIPALLAAALLFCTVPGPRKAKAVRAALQDPISTACPATILRRQKGVVLYLDSESAREIDTAIAGR